jgi:orotate phosphoribosyltransferase
MILRELVKENIIQRGEFKLKSNQTSNIYINLKNIISFPKLNLQICDMIYSKIRDDNNLICGTPYGAVPFSSYISIKHNIPMIFIRKEQKDYGTKKLVEGNYNQNDKVILIEDVVTSGNSVFETASKLEEHGVIVSQIITVFSRNDNKCLKFKDIPIEYLFHISDLDVDKI